jgi:hypothetical protein
MKTFEALFDRVRRVWAFFSTVFVDNSAHRSLGAEPELAG